MPLNDMAARQAKPRERPYKLSDANGLHLLVNPTGSKLWRLQYRIAGKQKTLAVGAYPAITLAKAREQRDAARTLIVNGIDPSASQKRAKREEKLRNQNTIEAVARRWIQSRSFLWSSDYRGYVEQRLETNIFPFLGYRPIADVEPPELLSCLRRIEKRDAFEMANRVRGLCSQFWRYAIGEGTAERDAAADLKGVLTVHKSRKHPRVPLKELPGLLQAVNSCEQQPWNRNRLTRIRLQLLSHVALRPGELRSAPWTEIAWNEATWHIPAERMKMERDHLVPLSWQALAILRELHDLTGAGKLMFPGEGKKGVMSENTLNNALHALGYKGRHCSHGFRDVMSTVLNERKFDSDWIELQLSHVEENEVRAAYNEAMWLDQRRAMLQWYSDYLDLLRSGEFVRPTMLKKPPELAEMV